MDIKEKLKRMIIEQNNALIEYRTLWESDDSDTGNAYDEVYKEEKEKLNIMLDLLEQL